MYNNNMKTAWKFSLAVKSDCDDKPLEVGISNMVRRYIINIPAYYKRHTAYRLTKINMATMPDFEVMPDKLPYIETVGLFKLCYSEA